MATRTQILIQQEQDAQYINGEVTLPPPLEPSLPTDPPQLVILQGTVIDGTNYGGIIVEDGGMEVVTDDLGIINCGAY